MPISESMEELEKLIVPDAEYPIWSPYASFDAAKLMLDALNAEPSDHE